MNTTTMQNTEIIYMELLMKIRKEQTNTKLPRIDYIYNILKDLPEKYHNTDLIYKLWLLKCYE